MDETHLVVEDDTALGTTLKERLAKEGYQVSWAQTLAAAREFAAKEKFDLAILDLGLPDGDGFSIGRDREILGNAPIVFLTAMNSAEWRLEAFELGAADYIPKPFHLKELLLRVEKILPKEGPAQRYQFKGLAVDVPTMSIVFDDGAREFLAQREFQFLKVLIEAAPEALQRDEALRNIWGQDSNQRTIDNTVLKLRNILQRTGEECIRSVRGIGYQWMIPKI